MDDPSSFNEARQDLLEALAHEEGTSLLSVVREYNNNHEFKRRIDLAALNMSCPTSLSIH